MDEEFEDLDILDSIDEEEDQDFFFELDENDEDDPLLQLDLEELSDLKVYDELDELDEQLNKKTNLFIQKEVPHPNNKIILDEKSLENLILHIEPELPSPNDNLLHSQHSTNNIIKNISKYSLNLSFFLICLLGPLYIYRQKILNKKINDKIRNDKYKLNELNNNKENNIKFYLKLLNLIKKKQLKYNYKIKNIIIFNFFNIKILLLIIYNMKNYLLNKKFFINSNNNIKNLLKLEKILSYYIQNLDSFIQYLKRRKISSSYLTSFFNSTSISSSSSSSLPSSSNSNSFTSLNPDLGNETVEYDEILLTRDSEDNLDTEDNIHEEEKAEISKEEEVNLEEDEEELLLSCEECLYELHLLMEHIFLFKRSKEYFIQSTLEDLNELLSEECLESIDNIVLYCEILRKSKALPDDLDRNASFIINKFFITKYDKFSRRCFDNIRNDLLLESHLNSTPAKELQTAALQLLDIGSPINKKKYNYLEYNESLTYTSRNTDLSSDNESISTYNFNSNRRDSEDINTSSTIESIEYESQIIQESNFIPSNSSSLTLNFSNEEEKRHSITKYLSIYKESRDRINMQEDKLSEDKERLFQSNKIKAKETLDKILKDYDDVKIQIKHNFIKYKSNYEKNISEIQKLYQLINTKNEIFWNSVHTFLSFFILAFFSFLFIQKIFQCNIYEIHSLKKCSYNGLLILSNIIIENNKEDYSLEPLDSADLDLYNEDSESIYNDLATNYIYNSQNVNGIQYIDDQPKNFGEFILTLSSFTYYKLITTFPFSGTSSTSSSLSSSLLNSNSSSSSFITSDSTIKNLSLTFQFLSSYLLNGFNNCSIKLYSVFKLYFNNLLGSFLTNEMIKIFTALSILIIKLLPYNIFYYLLTKFFSFTSISLKLSSFLSLIFIIILLYDIIVKLLIGPLKDLLLFYILHALFYYLILIFINKKKWKKNVFYYYFFYIICIYTYFFIIV